MSLYKLYIWFDKFAHDTFRRRLSKSYSERQLKDAKANYPDWKPLTKAQKREIAEFWGIKHPVSSDFLTHEIMLNVKGDYDVRYVPEKIFRLYLDPTLADRKLLLAWDDKNYFDRHQPSLPFPHTYVRNVNGYFLDHDYQLISREDALCIISSHLPIIVKPSLLSGEGKNIKLISTMEQAEEVLTTYPKNYLLQERIMQCDLLQRISPSSVGTMRFVTAIVDGEPVLLHSHLLCNTTDSIAVNANAKPGEGVVIIGLNEDGRLSDTGYFENAKKVQCMPSGFTFGGYHIPAYKEAVRLAVEAHRSVPMFGFMGWDVTVDKNNCPVFIEWNLRGIEIYHSQLSMDPLFGPYTDYFAKMARELIKNWQ